MEVALLLAVPGLAFAPVVEELGAPAIPEPELDERVGATENSEGEGVSKDAEVAGADDGAAPVPPARVES